VSRRHFGSVRRLPSGRYQAGYWHEGARHVGPSTFKTKADARAWLARVETAIRGGLWVDPAGAETTVDALAARWLASNPRKRRSSAARDETILRVHVLPSLGARPLGRVTRADLQGLVDAWAETHSASTVGRMYGVVRAMFAYATLSDLLARSPANGVRLPKVALIERPRPDPDALARLAGALGDDQAAMMWCGAVLGLRWAEAAGLQVRDLDVLSGTLHVRRQLGRDRRLGPPKTQAALRRLAVPAWLADDLSAVLARRGLDATTPEALLFVTPEGHPLDYSRWRQRVWVPACRSVGLTGLRFHDLRSMAATVLVTSGVDVRTAQARLGHSSPQVTLGLYARVTDQADRKAADAAGEYFRSRTNRARPIEGG
jgi:integrase